MNNKSFYVFQKLVDNFLINNKQNKEEKNLIINKYE